MHKETTCRETKEVDEQEKKTVHFVIRKIYLKAVTMYRQGSKKSKSGISILPVKRTPKTPSRARKKEALAVRNRF
jgi:hypothetical protein